MGQATAVCDMCNRELPIERFSRDGTKKIGRCRHCKDCHAAYMREWRRRKKEPRLYALYRGDDLLTVGTVEQLAAWQGVTVRTIKKYARPSARGRMRAYLIAEAV